MKELPKLVIAIGLCEIVGLLGTPFTINAIPTWYEYLIKPSFAPPNWIFGPVWTILYMLMGISLYLMWRMDWKKKKVKTTLNYFWVQLGLNFLWSISFFGFRSPTLGLVNIIALWIFIFLTMKHVYPLSKSAYYLLIPYILWVSFATLLNFAIVILN